MSIIADALQKAETPSTASGLPPSPRSLWAYRVLLLACVGFVLLGLGWITKHPGNHPPAVAQARTKSTSQKSTGLKLLRSAEGELSLTGIVHGGDGKSLALVNNQVVEEGDRIRGRRVVRVESNTVQLEDASGRVKTLQLKD